MFREALAFDHRAAVTVFDVFVLDFRTLGIDAYQGEPIAFFQHTLAPEESAGSKRFWRAKASALCPFKEAEQEGTFAAISFGNSKLGLVVSQAKDLGDYWKALGDWTFRDLRWPTNCSFAGRSDLRGVPQDWPAMSAYVAFGGLTPAALDQSLTPSELGLSCSKKTKVQRRRGILGGIRPAPPEPRPAPDPDLLLVRDDSVPLESFGLQHTAPYVWALVELDTQRIRAMGNLVNQSLWLR